MICSEDRFTLLGIMLKRDLKGPILQLNSWISQVQYLEIALIAGATALIWIRFVP